MAENRFPYAQSGAARDCVCIETNRILDSCRDRDCFENVRVYLSDFGNDILDRTGAIRAKCAEIMWANINIDPIQFNRGFYAVTIRFYVKLLFEACIGGGRSQEIEGIAVIEKRVILFGGESGVNTFRSSVHSTFCSCPEPTHGCRNSPTAVVETVDPVILGTKILESVSECNCCCCCHEHELPEEVMTSFDSPLCFDDRHDGHRFLTVSIGIFSVVRIVRPAQYLIQATEYAIPEKECVAVEEDDPCRVFRTMPFPVGEFSSQGMPQSSCGSVNHERADHSDRSCRCGC